MKLVNPVSPAAIEAIRRSPDESEALQSFINVFDVMQNCRTRAASSFSFAKARGVTNRFARGWTDKAVIEYAPEDFLQKHFYVALDENDEVSAHGMSIAGAAYASGMTYGFAYAQTHPEIDAESWLPACSECILGVVLGGKKMAERVSRAVFRTVHRLPVDKGEYDDSVIFVTCMAGLEDWLDLNDGGAEGSGAEAAA